MTPPETKGYWSNFYVPAALFHTIFQKIVIADSLLTKVTENTNKIEDRKQNHQISRHSFSDTILGAPNLCH